MNTIENMINVIITIIILIPTNRYDTDYACYFFSIHQGVLVIDVRV